ncbi:hypothetical protein ASPZODRAFT_1219056 [Penicilliopsis zonata CBS 506.65]|uniref:Uncharacterized protein n=1 Tax=Penicilliopsis zonata CBS 506.65 TaxID=1073090 RepID=A0A1L9S7H5_9EURO|nr:hypothetical protein ASPZODRAFT_1219056 [Penicilliopsis zonata CBS 506.65]OJJ43110.1 hypothetical protein ASPZODRAFT_1219056 [Penicilliopsis zonata CBS 506.65]
MNLIFCPWFAFILIVVHVVDVGDVELMDVSSAKYFSKRLDKCPKAPKKETMPHLFLLVLLVFLLLLLLLLLLLSCSVPQCHPRQIKTHL